MTNMAETESINTANKDFNVYPHISSKQVEPLPITTLGLQGSKGKKRQLEKSQNGFTLIQQVSAKQMQVPSLQRTIISSWT